MTVTRSGRFGSQSGTPTRLSTTSEANSIAKDAKTGSEIASRASEGEYSGEERVREILDLFKLRGVIPLVVCYRRGLSITLNVVPNRRFRRVPIDESSLV
jgi:hypothetical protein